MKLKMNIEIGIDNVKVVESAKKHHCIILSLSEIGLCNKGENDDFCVA